MTTLLRFVIVILTLHVQILAEAKVERKGSQMIVSGIIGNDPTEFQQILKDDGVVEVVFKDCLGGDYKQSIALFLAIYQKKIRTSFTGQCTSGCAWAFMGGSERRENPRTFGTNVIGFHGAYYDASSGFPNLLTDEDIKEKNARQAQAIRTRSRQKFAPDLMRVIEQTGSADEGVFFIREYFPFISVKEKLAICLRNKKAPSEPVICTERQDGDLKSMGIVTD